MVAKSAVSAKGVLELLEVRVPTVAANAKQMELSHERYEGRRRGNH